jgi:aminoglycoside phosphotransferase (APT) family kinase protein
MFPPASASSFSSSEASISTKVQPETESLSKSASILQLIEGQHPGHPTSFQDQTSVTRISDSIPPTSQIELEPTLLDERHINAVSPSAIFSIAINESTLADMDAKYAENHPQKSIPDLEFNLWELLSIATAAMNSPCTMIKLLGFGMFNKAYLLTFSNGKEAVARLPYTELRTRYRLQSEVGAMKYAAAKLPNEWKSLVPAVFAWDSDPQNPVGKPYLLMEKMSGATLASQVSTSLSKEKKLSIAKQLARFTSALYELGSNFTQIGGVYCKNDDFEVGPLIRNWSDDARQRPEFDNGPWKSTRDFMAAQFQQLFRVWMDYYAPQVNAKNFFRRTNVDEVIRFIKQAVSLIPKFDPRVLTGDPDADNRRGFVHTDLSEGNILIDPISAKLVGIIDWEAAGVLSEPFAVRIPSWLHSPTVYNATTPLDQLDERYRELFIELTDLRETYCVERISIDGPDYYQALVSYDDLYKLEECLEVYLFDPEALEEQRKWIVEKMKRR